MSSTVIGAASAIEKEKTMHHMHGFGGFGGPMFGGFGMGGGLLGDLLAGGLGYYLGRSSAQSNAQYAPSYQQYPQQPPYPQPAPVDPSRQRLAQLQLLGHLRESGILTEEEFEQEKQRILAGI
jgi:hypothetical protein